MSGDKTVIFKIILGLVLIIFSLRLFYLQVYNSEYRTLSEENIVHLETIYPSRGIIYDRNDSILVENGWPTVAESFALSPELMTAELEKVDCLRWIDWPIKRGINKSVKVSLLNKIVIIFLLWFVQIYKSPKRIAYY